jgi:hypothetical protein
MLRIAPSWYHLRWQIDDEPTRSRPRPQLGEQLNPYARFFRLAPKVVLTPEGQLGLIDIADPVAHALCALPACNFSTSCAPRDQNKWLL